MTEHQQVYRSEAEKYEALVAREDYQGNILTEIRRAARLEGQDVVELGAGTGRITCMLAPLVHSIAAFDESVSMLEVARGKMEALPRHNWRLQAADNRSIPMPANCADLVISGWSICYFASWGGAGWKIELFRSFSEMKRLLRPEGRIILLETMGTGFETPHPPAHLAEYYQVLDQLNFQQAWFRTDYLFKDNAEAAALTAFFFGQELAGQVISSASNRLPECTGIWWIDQDQLQIPKD